MSDRMPDLRAIVTALQAQAEQLAEDIAEVVRTYAPVAKRDEQDEQRTPGTFRASLAGRGTPTESGLIITVDSDDEPVAGYVVDGTSGHLIKATHLLRTKRGKTIVGFLSWDGAVHPVRAVHHPGTAPNPFADQAAGEITAIAEAAVDQAVQAVAP